MSIVDDSSTNSSSSDDFAAYLDSELESTSDASPEPEKDANDTHHPDMNKKKRQKLEVLESVTEANDSTSHHKTGNALEVSLCLCSKIPTKEDICTHPGRTGGMCMKCRKKINIQSGVALAYIYEDLWLDVDELVRLRHKDLKNLLSHTKLCLVLDLDYTLLNST